VEWTSRLGQRRYQPPPDLPGSNAWKTTTQCTNANENDATPTYTAATHTAAADDDFYPNTATPAERRVRQNKRWSSELNRRAGGPAKTSGPWQEPNLGEPPF
jgi:hypothetical protein